MQLSSRATSLTPSLTLSIDSKAKAMKSEGIDVCSFGAGEPDFDTPEHIKAAAIASLEAGFTKYTPSSGIPELRQAIAEKFLADNGMDYKPSQIIVSDGTIRKRDDAAHQGDHPQQSGESDRSRLLEKGTSSNRRGRRRGGDFDPFR